MTRIEMRLGLAINPHLPEGWEVFVDGGQAFLFVDNVEATNPAGDDFLDPADEHVILTDDPEVVGWIAGTVTAAWQAIDQARLDAENARRAAEEARKREHAEALNAAVRRQMEART